MQGKWKKAAAGAAAGAIIAAQAMMHVAAAGGSINADMSTKIPVLRVVVPTSMAVSVNEFQMGDAGSQVTSGEFDMKNLSEIPVNVKVTSTATLGSGVTLVGTRAAAAESTDEEHPAMWLAAVAAVNKNGSTYEYAATGDDKTIAALGGMESNATAFVTGDDGKGKAIQNFYLDEATAAAYKAIASADAEAIGSGADFYKLTKLSPASDDAAGAAALAADKDIYVVGGTPVDGIAQEITKVNKGTAAADITWTASASEAYSLADEATSLSDVKTDTTGVYMYIDSATEDANGVAAFRYAGALSAAKSGWSTTELSAITIAYDITAIPSPTYDEIAGADGSGLTYGYKAEENAQVTFSTDGLITIAAASGDIKSLVVNDGTDDYPMNSTRGTWEVFDEDSDVQKFQLADGWVEYLKGKSAKAVVTLQDDSTIESVVVDFPE